MKGWPRGDVAKVSQSKGTPWAKAGKWEELGILRLAQLDGSEQGKKRRRQGQSWSTEWGLSRSHREFGLILRVMPGPEEEHHIPIYWAHVRDQQCSKAWG